MFNHQDEKNIATERIKNYKQSECNLKHKLNDQIFMQ